MHSNHHHGQGHRRHTSRTAVMLNNLPSRQVTSSLYVAFRMYGDIARVKRDEASTAVIAFSNEIDALEMRRWEDQVQIDGLPLMVAFAESAVDEEVEAAKEAVPGEGEWKCWLCLNINSDEDEICSAQNCDVVKGIDKKQFDATLSVDFGESRPPGLIPQRKRRVIIATDIPKDTDRGSIRRVFGRYGKIVCLWVNQVGSATEAQVVFDKEESADAAVEFEHNRVLDSQPIIVWKATTAYVVEVQPVTVPWVSTSAEVPPAAMSLREAFSQYGAITNVRVYPQAGYVEFPSLTSALSVLESEPRPVVNGVLCHTSLSTKFSKWPCLSCTFPHNPAKSRQCAQCSVIKPNFKIINLPVAWPMQVEVVKASLAAQREDQKKHQKEHGKGRGGQYKQQPLTAMPNHNHKQNNHQEFGQHKVWCGVGVGGQEWHGVQKAAAVVPVAPPPTAVAPPSQQQHHHMLATLPSDPLPPPTASDTGDVEVKNFEDLFQEIVFGAHESYATDVTAPKEQHQPPQDLFSDLISSNGAQGIIGSRPTTVEDDPWANAISFTKPGEEEDGGLGGLLWGLKMGGDGDDAGGLLSSVPGFAFDN